MAADCHKSGIEFLSYLDALINQSVSSNPLRNFSASVKYRFEHHKIEDFSTKLDKLRSALTLATILALRSSMDSSNSEMHSTVLQLMDTLQDQAGPKLDAISAQIHECLEKIEGFRNEMPQNRVRAILTWLNFRQISWRYEEIPVAYQRTFQWIFENPTSEDSWDDFSAYLRGKDINTPYFINGKAGSGKSTLMKFVVDHADTKKALAQWAENDELIVAKFFFWNLGTPLQKSNLGMLRALMHTILQAHPELIPAMFPEIYRNWKDNETMEEPTYFEVKRSFEMLIAKSATFLKLCIFIDGIDESEGDHRDLSEFIRSLASSKVKVVISSRPINSCLNAFSKCPTLMLHDLTGKDMEIFVQGNLASHQSMVHLMRRYPEDTRDIVTELKEKAQGVFLWIKLVVRLLVDGLESGDNMEDLRNKLRSLPPDLKDLYRRMIAKITPEYQVQAAEMFQLLHTWQSMIGGSLATIAFHFAIQPPSKGLSLPVGPIDPETLSWYHDQTAARIRSRCCGLIEVRHYANWQNPNDFMVIYMHRTIAEFLTSDDVWDEVCGMTNPGFDPPTNLASACLSVMKISGSLKEHSCLLNHLDFIIRLYRKATPQSQETLNDYITALDQTMTQYQNDPYEGQTISLERGNHWSEYLESGSRFFIPVYRLENSASIFTFAAHNRLVQYLKAHYDRQRTINSSDGLALVISAIGNSLYGNPHTTSHELRDTLFFLLGHVAQPEDLWFGNRLFRRSLSDIARGYGKSLIRFSIIWACFITTARSPEAFIRTYCSLEYSDALCDVVSSLQEDDDPENKNLGYQLEYVCRITMGDAYEVDRIP